MKQCLKIATALLLLVWAAPAMAFDHSHKLWNADLKRYVENGYVHYGAWKRERANLDRYLKSLESVGFRDVQQWKPAERYAFWINAYNAIVVATILDHYPFKLGSKIISIRGMYDETRWSIAGQQVTLDNIRDNILRKADTRAFLISDITGHDTQMGSGADVRVLLAVCNGSIRAAPLRSEAYVAKKLNRQLDAQAKLVINDPAYVEVIAGRKTIKAGYVFKQFKRDFDAYAAYPAMFEKSSASDRGLLRFLFHYQPRATQDEILARQKSPWRFQFENGNMTLNGGE